MMPSSTGPRQIIAWLCSTRNPMLMISMPSAFMGMILLSPCSLGFCFNPVMIGSDGPYRSQSSSATLAPL